MTLAELILWGRLKDRKVFQAKFRRQHPVDIFIVDFYCHEYKLVIEIDGEIHNNENRRDYDLGRTAELKKFGIRVIRFTNEEVVYKIDQVVNRILKIITELTPLQGGRGAKKVSLIILVAKKIYLIVRENKDGNGLAGIKIAGTGNDVESINLEDDKTLGDCH